MNKRQTIEVSKIKDLVNERNQKPGASWNTAAIRGGQNILLEEILHLTGNYKGFNYYRQNELSPGDLPGCIMGIDENGEYTGVNEFPDETRRYYY